MWKKGVDEYLDLIADNYSEYIYRNDNESCGSFFTLSEVCGSISGFSEEDTIIQNPGRLSNDQRQGTPNPQAYRPYTPVQQVVELRNNRTNPFLPEADLPHLPVVQAGNTNPFGYFSNQEITPVAPYTKTERTSYEGLQQPPVVHQAKDVNTTLAHERGPPSQMNVAEKRDHRPQQETEERQLMMRALVRNNLPHCEPDIFYGDPTKFHSWKNLFRAMLEGTMTSATQELAYLLKYTSKDARNLVMSYRGRNLEPTSCLNDLWQELKKRFGNPAVVANSYLKQLTEKATFKEDDRRATELSQICAATSTAR